MSDGTPLLIDDHSETASVKPPSCFGKLIKFAKRILTCGNIIVQAIFAGLLLSVYVNKFIYVSSHTFYDATGIISNSTEAGEAQTVSIVIDTSSLPYWSEELLLEGKTVGLTPETNSNLSSVKTCYALDGHSVHNHDQVLYTYLTFEYDSDDYNRQPQDPREDEVLMLAKAFAIFELILVVVAYLIAFYLQYRMIDGAENIGCCGENSSFEKWVQKTLQSPFRTRFLISILPYCQSCCLIPITCFVYSNGVCIHSLRNVFINSGALITIFYVVFCISLLYVIAVILNTFSLCCCGDQVDTTEYYGSGEYQTRNPYYGWKTSEKLQLGINILKIVAIAQGIMGFSFTLYMARYELVLSVGFTVSVYAVYVVNFLLNCFL